MKKSLRVLILVMMFVILSSCNDVNGHSNGVTLTILDEIAEHLIYQGSLPSLEFKYEGTLNVAKSSTKANYYFGKNDYYQFSEAYGQHLDNFGLRYLITSDIKEKNDETHAKFGKDKLIIDNPERGARELMVVAWDSNGNRFSYHYRTFVSNDKTYYIYPYSSPIAATMEIPLMVVEETVGAEKNKLVLLNLPYDTKYEVNINLKLDTLIYKDDYLIDKYYQFDYPLSLKDLLLSEKKQQIIKWYIDYCHGTQIDENNISYTYLGNKFKVTLQEGSFIVKWEGINAN